MLKAEEQELLTQLAHQSWIERGRPTGSPEVDWERAKERLVALERQRLKDLDQAARPTGATEATTGGELLPSSCGVLADIRVVNADAIERNLQPANAPKRAVKKTAKSARADDQSLRKTQE